jgi:hypothetical protein
LVQIASFSMALSVTWLNKNNKEHHMPDHQHEGGCLCGQVRYTVIGQPEPRGVCHCRYCQLRTGSAFAVLAYFQPQNFQLQHGELSHYHFTSESDKNWDTYFCPRCGTTVYYQLEVWGDLIGIDAGTFDPPSFFFDIAGEVFTQSKAHFLGEITADNHYEMFPGYEPRNEEPGRLKTPS